MPSGISHDRLSPSHPSNSNSTSISNYTTHTGSGAGTSSSSSSSSSSTGGNWRSPGGDRGREEDEDEVPVPNHPHRKQQDTAPALTSSTSTSSSNGAGGFKLRPLQLNLHSPISSSFPKSASSSSSISRELGSSTTTSGTPTASTAPTAAAAATATAFHLDGLNKGLDQAIGDLPRSSPTKANHHHHHHHDDSSNIARSPLSPSSTAAPHLARNEGGGGGEGGGQPIAVTTSNPANNTTTTTTTASATQRLRTMSPTTPTTPSSARPAPRNPLIDLIETEKGYVDDLAMIIKKVAAAWSRSNFPPPALDTMFRAIEGVYRIAKQFMAKLNEIGPNPSSPKALGDLLMRWIDDLEPAYTRYVNSYKVDYDNYAPVQGNPNLQPILQGLPALSSSPTLTTNPTLDTLFQLPWDRLRYYKKLYAKLLKSTQPGKGDHKLLVTANDKLDWLLDTAYQSSLRKVTDDGARSIPSNQQEHQQHQQQQQQSQARRQDSSAPVPPTPTNIVPQPSNTPAKIPLPPLDTGRRGSETASTSGSSVERSSGQTTMSATSTAISSDTSTQQQQQQSTGTAQMAELEQRLDTSRTLDIFSMKLKKCKLQMNPPNLTYQRLIRKAGDVQVSFIPSSDPGQQEIFTPSACIYLLTDLFLLCERIADPASDARKTNPRADLWLMYPPLATKHLRVHKIDTSTDHTAFEVEIMRREKLTFFVNSPQQRDEWFDVFNEAIAFTGGAQSLRVNTDVNRAVSPASISSAYARGTATSSLSGQSTGQPSPLPPLPLSASTPNFPNSASSAPPSGRSSTPGSDPAARTGDLRSPAAPNSAPGMYGRNSPAGYPPSSHGQPPVTNEGGMRHTSPNLGHSPRLHSLPSPARANFAPIHPDANRSLPPNPNSASSPALLQTQHLPPPPGGYHNGGAMNHNVGHQHPDPSMNGRGPYPPPLPPGATHGMIHKQPSTRSVSSLASRSSKASMPGTASTAPTSPIPPLPFKDANTHHHFQNQNQVPHAGLYGMNQDVRSGPGGLLSPVGSQQQHHQQQQYQGQMPIHRSRSAEGLRQQDPYRMPSSVLKDSLRGRSLPSQNGSNGQRSLPGSRMNSGYLQADPHDISPPPSPTRQGPVTSQLAAQMKCKVFIQQAHGQWKSLGTAKLKLYLQSTQKKQLVVESDKAVLISTIVLEDGVERVGKTGVAVEISDNESRTGIVYMLQLKTEQSATGLFQQLLLGSTRAPAVATK